MRFLIPKDSLVLLKHTKNYFGASVFIKGIGFIVLPIFTRLLNPSDFGILSIYESVLYFFTVILSMAVEESIKRYYFEDKLNFGKVGGSMIIFVGFVSTIILSIIFIFSYSISGFLKIPQNIIIIAAIIAYITTPMSIYLSVLNAQQRSKLYSKIIVSRSVFGIILSIIFILFLSKEKYLGRVYGQLLMVFCFSFLGIKFIIKNFIFKYNFKDIKYFLIYSLPLIPYRLSGLILTSIDIIIIGQLSGMKNAGVYSISYKIGLILIVVQSAISLSMEPIFMTFMSKKKYFAINQLINYNAKIIFLVAVVLILFGENILIVVAPKEYHDALSIIPVIVVSYCFLFIYEQFTRVLRYYKKTYVNTVYMFISGIVNIFLNYWLIPLYSYKIAAYTTLFSMMLLFLFYWFHVRIIIKNKNIINVGLLVLYLSIAIVIALFNNIIICDLNVLFGYICRILMIVLIFIIYFLLLFDNKKYRKYNCD